MAESIKESREEQIRRRAYEIYVQRIADGQPGTAESDWHLAEIELGEIDEET